MNAFRRHSIPALAVPACVALLASPSASDDRAPASAPYFTRASTPSAAPDADGFLRRWMLLEPIVVQVRSNQQLTDSFVQAASRRSTFRISSPSFRRTVTR